MLWDFSTNELLVSFTFFCSYAFITGWMIDRILLSVGFGTIGNWLLLLIGAYSGLFAVNMYGYEFDWFPEITLSVVFGTTLLLFLFMCTVKRVFYL